MTTDERTKEPHAPERTNERAKTNETRKRREPARNGEKGKEGKTKERNQRSTYLFLTKTEAALLTDLASVRMHKLTLVWQHEIAWKNSGGCSNVNAESDHSGLALGSQQARNPNTHGP